MLKPFYKLSFPVECITDAAKARDINDYSSVTNWTLSNFPTEEFLTPEIIEYFHSTLQVELAPQMAMFTVKSNTSGFIHIDHVPPTIEKLQRWGLNFVWGSSNSKMSWYTVKDFYKTSHYTFDRLQVQKYDMDEVDLLLPEMIINEGDHWTPYLVRTDIPHNVTNNDPMNVRCCASIRGYPLDLLTWDEIVEIMKPCII